MATDPQTHLVASLLGLAVVSSEPFSASLWSFHSHKSTKYKPQINKINQKSNPNFSATPSPSRLWRESLRERGNTNGGRERKYNIKGGGFGFVDEQLLLCLEEEL
jgi:hypothetical protein